MKKLNKGFTLVELLATLFILGLIFTIGGSYFINVIKNSKDTTKVLTEATIKKTANTYVKEYPEEVSWDEEKEENKYACVLVDLLVEKGYIEQSKIDKSNYKHVKVIKDVSGNIISEELVEPSECSNVPMRVPIPDSSICKSFKGIEFGDDQSLIKEDIGHIGYIYDENLKASLPGTYYVDLTLKDKNVWSDGTSEVKKVACTIDKKLPLVELDSYQSAELGLETYKINMTSNVSGDVKIKVSNNNYVTTNTKEGTITKDGNFELEITTLAGRKTDTYITLTVIPTGEDAEHYYNTSVVHVVKVKDNLEGLTKVEIPTTETACNSNLVYNENEQSNPQQLFKDNEGYEPIGETGYGKNAGEYEVVVKLKDGYKWSDNSLSNKRFKCTIKKKDTNIELIQSSSVIADLVGKVNKDSTINISSIRGYYKSDGKIKDIPGVISIASTDYISASVSKHASYNEDENSLYTADLKGIKAGEKQKFIVNFTPKNPNFNVSTKEYLLTIENNTYTLTYNATKNGGTACNPGTKQVTYNEPYGQLCTPTKSGYEFLGWYTSATNRNTKVTASTKLTTAGNVTIYAHFKKTITITLKSYNGSSLVTDTRTGTMYNTATSVNITLPSFSSYKNSCGTWDKIGWSKSTSAGSSKDYSRNGTYSFSSSMTLYARYEIESVFIYDYNGGSYIPSVYETSYASASGKTKNMGPFYETVDQDARRSGYTFIGWYKGSTRKVKPGQTKTLSYDCGETYMISAQWQ